MMIVMLTAFSTFLGDIDASKDNLLSGGFYEQSHSEEPLSYTYTYDELKIVLEGELQIKGTEPVVLLVAIYLGIRYAILYLSFMVISLVCIGTRHFSDE